MLPTFKITTVLSKCLLTLFKSNSSSQDAHEAIRPANVNLVPKNVKKLLSNDQYKLYKLIWERFVASQMAVAIFDTVSVELENSGYTNLVSNEINQNLFTTLENDESVVNCYYTANTKTVKIFFIP